MVDILIAIAMTLLVCDYMAIFCWMLTGVVSHSYDECAKMRDDPQLTLFHVW